MSKCPDCGFKNLKEADTCAYCGAKLTDNEEDYSYVSTYKTSRFLMKVISFSGWIILIISLLFTLGTCSGGSNFESTIQLLFYILGIYLGLTTIIFGQVTRAVLDSTDYLGEILEVLKSKK